MLAVFDVSRSMTMRDRRKAHGSASARRDRRTHASRSTGAPPEAAAAHHAGQSNQGLAGARHKQAGQQGQAVGGRSKFYSTHRRGKDPNPASFQRPSITRLKRAIRGKYGVTKVRQGR